MNFIFVDFIDVIFICVNFKEGFSIKEICNGGLIYVFKSFFFDLVLEYCLGLEYVVVWKIIFCVIYFVFN